MTDPDVLELEIRAVREQEAEIAERKRQRDIRIQKEKMAAQVVIPSLPDTANILELARAEENAAFKVIIDMMNDPEAPSAVRKSCAELVIDRSRGKAAQEGSKNNKDLDKDKRSVNIPQQIILDVLTNEQLNAIISKLNEIGFAGEDTAPDVQ